ncbi:MAG: hypothetical protein D6714_19105 [Bacteroidetes bacterium]|nr:MAG: hypothetical protein D6714_19105 [Bacteroidota bacterium]
MSPSSPPGGGFECRHFSVFRALVSFEKSIQWAVFSIQSAGFFIRPGPARAKVGKRETCDRRPKTTEPFIFTLKKNRTRLPAHLFSGGPRFEGREHFVFMPNQSAPSSAKL